MDLQTGNRVKNCHQGAGQYSKSRDYTTEILLWVNLLYPRYPLVYSFYLGADHPCEPPAWLVPRIALNYFVLLLLSLLLFFLGFFCVCIAIVIVIVTLTVTVVITIIIIIIIIIIIEFHQKDGELTVDIDMVMSKSRLICSNLYKCYDNNEFNIHAKIHTDRQVGRHRDPIYDFRCNSVILVFCLI